MRTASCLLDVFMEASLCNGKGKDTIRVCATEWVEGGWQIEDTVALASHAVGWGTIRHHGWDERARLDASVDTLGPAVSFIDFAGLPSCSHSVTTENTGRRYVR